MTDRPPFSEHMREVEGGSPDAVWRLVELYSPHVYRVVRRRMPEGLRRRFDSSDLVQTLWASVLLRDRDFTQFPNEAALRAFLAQVAINKIRMAVRTHVHTQARSQCRERSIDAALPNAADPTPSDVVAFRDAWQNYLAKQPRHHQRIVELRMQGMTYDEIAAEVQLNERTVRRVLMALVSEVTA